MKPVAEQIRAEIGRDGAISFARFMDLALYCPNYGYYEQKTDTVGKRGDFYTSVSVGPLFGELLAFQFAEWLEAEVGSQKSEVSIVEAGAHDGRLAKDILSWLKLRRPALFERLEYRILEPSAQRQEWQRETLQEFLPHIHWQPALTHHASRITGIIFSNELLDAIPVHRLGWDAKEHEWFEWGVTIQGDRFDWCRLPNSIHATRNTQHAAATGNQPSAILALPPDLLAALPDGFTTEICPAAETWWRGAAQMLERGKLLTIDYGLNAEEFFVPQRANGTLRAYHRHQVSDDVLANPGEQDLTAHVNFTAIQQAGEAAGLKTESLCTQAQFLTQIGARAWSAEGVFGPWTPEHGRQFQTLTHPQHLGRAFRVLVQSR